MARLHNAVDGSHFFIRPGPNQGTLQVYPEGIAWLKLHHNMPKNGEDIYLDSGTIYRLKREGHLYIRGEQNNYSNRETDFEFEQRFAMFFGGLPLLLQQKEQRETGWELYLDLSELGKEVWEELQSHHADSITASSAAPMARRQLVYGHGLLRVYPFPHPYQIFSYTDKSKRLLEHAPETPGLNDKWQGNVFMERATQANTWQRHLPGSSITYRGALLWLAKADRQPDWPGQATKVGNINTGWQLWRLTVNETAPIVWEAIKNWFKDRVIDVVPQRQRLEIVSIPSAITGDGQYIIKPGKTVWIACYPPRRLAEGISREISLSAEQIGSDTDLSTRPSKSISPSRSADRVNYFRWSADQTGAYRIHVQGDASSEPLLVQVGTPSITQPRWLDRLSSTVTFAEREQTLYAFDDTLDVERGPYVMDSLSHRKLAALTWIYEPEGLPIRASWNYSSLEKILQRDNFCLIYSSNELTRCWQEKICSALATGVQAKVRLDGGSFGNIELVVELPAPLETKAALLTDERLTAQFTWLSQMIEEKPRQKRIPLPVALREKLRHLHAQSASNITIRIALEKLAAANIVQEWISYRLRVLLAEIEKPETVLKAHDEY